MIILFIIKVKILFNEYIYFINKEKNSIINYFFVILILIIVL